VSANSFVISNRWASDPACVVFRVIERTRNGWLRCLIHCEQNGQPIPGDHVFRFRVGDMVAWEGGRP